MVRTASWKVRSGLPLKIAGIEKTSEWESKSSGEEEKCPSFVSGMLRALTGLVTEEGHSGVGCGEA